MCKIQLLEKLTKIIPSFIAIIEECFPSEAMSDQEEFYDAKNNPTLAKNAEIMMDSCE